MTVFFLKVQGNGAQIAMAVKCSISISRLPVIKPVLDGESVLASLNCKLF